MRYQIVLTGQTIPVAGVNTQFANNFLDCKSASEKTLIFPARAEERAPQRGR